MTINQSKQIQDDFANMQSKEDLLVLLNKVKSYLYAEKNRDWGNQDYTIKYLNYYTYSKLCKKRYQKFEIPKKSGGFRVIHAPNPRLNSILKNLNVILQLVSITNDKAYGFMPNKSIVDNAKRHTNQNYVYNIDLKDFFFSFDQNRIKMMLHNAPYNIKNLSVCSFIATLVTHHIEENKGNKLSDAVLPQGSPTSPTLTNMLCYNLDRRLNGMAKRFNVTYSRYADDITFSSDRNVFRKEEFQAELVRIIEKDQNLEINPKKTRLQTKGNRQEVTGLTVNNQVNVISKYVKSVRMYLYYCEKYDIKKGSILYAKDIGKETSPEKLMNILRGKIDFLAMVKGKRNDLVQKLYTRYRALAQNDSTIKDVLKLWEIEGIELAMMKYNNHNA